MCTDFVLHVQFFVHCTLLNILPKYFISSTDFQILLDEMGLNYICTTAERFYAVANVLGNMVIVLKEVPSVRLLKHIVRCYLRLSDNLRAREALRLCLPDALRDATFAHALKDDVSVKRWLTQLLFNISEGGGGNPL